MPPWRNGSFPLTALAAVSYCPRRILRYVPCGDASSATLRKDMPFLPADSPRVSHRTFFPSTFFRSILRWICTLFPGVYTYVFRFLYNLL